MMTLWVDADSWGSTKDYLAADVFGLIADYGVDAGKRGVAEDKKTKKLAFQRLRTIFGNLNGKAFKATRFDGLN